ncbi:MAG TPA: 3'-5' exonuclease, partial [Kofleriaceae bacterium]|nr:3'-5' exonuclease [Kofleriaceae bacterium]
QFAQGIAPDADLVAIERRGERPTVVAHRTRDEERRYIQQAIEKFSSGGYRTMGIICKSPKQADELHQALSTELPGVHLLNARSTAFAQGAVVCSVHLAKGLEFDQVLVPEVTDENYGTALERNLLYVACTRAMHALVLTHVGTATRFLPEGTLYDPGCP